MMEIQFRKKKGEEEAEQELINVEEFISIKGYKAIGNRLTSKTVNQINLLDPLPFEGAVEEQSKEEDDNSEDQSSLF